MHVRKGDIVEVIAGDDRGTGGHRTSGRVLRVNSKKGKVIVEGIKQVYRHLRPSQRNPQGGRLQKESPVDASDVLLWCDRCARGVRIGRRVNADGSKERVCRKCGASLGVIRGPKP